MHFLGLTLLEEIVHQEIFIQGGKGIELEMILVSKVLKARFLIHWLKNIWFFY